MEMTMMMPIRAQEKTKSVSSFVKGLPMLLLLQQDYLKLSDIHWMSYWLCFIGFCSRKNWIMQTGVFG
jgi:hypothetical protein